MDFAHLMRIINEYINLFNEKLSPFEIQSDICLLESQLGIKEPNIKLLMNQIINLYIESPDNVKEIEAITHQICMYYYYMYLLYLVNPRKCMYNMSDKLTDYINFPSYDLPHIELNLFMSYFSIQLLFVISAKGIALSKDATLALTRYYNELNDAKEPSSEIIGFLDIIYNVFDKYEYEPIAFD